MADIKIRRVPSLPPTLDPSCLYIVKGAGDTEVVLYFTGKSGSEVRHTLRRSEVSAMISAAKDGTGIPSVSLLPPATPELAGRLFNLSSDGNKPCWCDGTQWIDLFNNPINNPSTTVDNTLIRKLRNDLYFGIKLI